MKTFLTIVLTLIATFTFSVSAKASIEEVTPTPSSTIDPNRLNVLNTLFSREDKNTPYLQMEIIGFRKTEMENIAKWRIEMNEKVVRVPKDDPNFYEKVGAIIAEYLPKFFKSGALAVHVTFPKAIAEVSEENQRRIDEEKQRKVK